MNILHNIIIDTSRDHWMATIKARHATEAEKKLATILLDEVDRLEARLAKEYALPKVKVPGDDEAAEIRAYPPSIKACLDGP
jgi:hypothetical protein